MWRQCYPIPEMAQPDAVGGLEQDQIARLEFSPEEVCVFTEQLSRIVDYVNQLQAINTEGVEPLAHALPVHNVFRPDEPAPSLGVGVRAYRVTATATIGGQQFPAYLDDPSVVLGR